MSTAAIPSAESTAPSSIAPPLSVYRDEAPIDPAGIDEASVGAIEAVDQGFYFRGMKLHPFNASRNALFSQHRLALGAPSLQLALNDVDGFAADAYRILWLCSHTPLDWSSLRCNPAKLQTVIDEWADKSPVTDAVTATLLGYQVYAASRSI